MERDSRSPDIQAALTAVPPGGADGHLLSALPHCKAMGMELLASADGCATLRLPYSEMLIGDPETGVISGGAVTALLDTCCGSAVMSSSAELLSTATLDLRIDYMRPATPKLPLLAEAEVYRVTKTIAFVRALAHHGDAKKPVASAAGAFILNRAEGKS